MAHDTSHSDDAGTRAAVEIRLPAEGVFASVLRTTATSLAARLDFTMEAIEDLRISIGEATALVLPEADPETDLVCAFYLSPGQIRVQLSASAVDEPTVDTDSFAWQVLTTMAAQVTAGAEQGRFSVGFTVHSEIPMPVGPGANGNATASTGTNA
jgi:serine/threonine-protein kinase RsbW